MDRARAEEDLRAALVAFEEACQALLAALHEGRGDVPRLLAQAEARLKEAQKRLESVPLRNREARD
jgi:hypothetical protein